MTESHTILVAKKDGSRQDVKELNRQYFPFGSLLKTINTHFELLLFITVLVSILVKSIF